LFSSLAAVVVLAAGTTSFLELAAPSPVAAQESANTSLVTGRLPRRAAARPLTLTGGTLRLDLDVSLQTQPSSFDLVTMASIPSDPIVGMAIGAGFGITADLEVGGQLVPLAFSPELRFGRPPTYEGLPWLYGRFRFLEGAFELAAQVRVFLPVPRPMTAGPSIAADFAVEIGVPLRLHIAGRFRLDSGIFVPILTPSSDPEDDVDVAFIVPLDFLVSFFETVYGGVRTSVVSHRFESVTIPLFVYGGVTIPGPDDGPLLDLTARFGFPRLFVPTADTDAGEDVVRGTPWEVGVTANFYFDLY
jgi:hypothetical protein